MILSSSRKQAQALLMAPRPPKPKLAVAKAETRSRPLPSRAGRPASPHYARAQRDRGAETRAELVGAALDVFGRLGFEGASTRAIAKAADANLAAIVYHFGGKEALYLAVAEHVADSIAGRIGPTIAAAANPAAASNPAAARAALFVLMETFVDVILGAADAERWARFLVREQMQPTAAFDVIYRFMSGAAETATRLVATILREPESDDVKLRVITIIGQILVFRVAQTLVLRRMGWRGIGDRQRRHIKRIVGENLAAILKGSTP
jgi:AcrR family transcriptional regulator